MNLLNLKRRWSDVPDRASAEMPNYYGNTPRLDPVRVIAKNCATVELKLYSKKDLRKNGESAKCLDSHELYDLLDNPIPTFPEIDGWTLRYLTFAYVDLTGECGWLKVRAENSKKIIALLPIPKSWMLHKPTINEHYYEITPYGNINGVVLKVLPEDVVYFKDIDLNDPYGNGKGMAQCVADELETDEYASKYQKNFFYNDATPPYVITGFQGNEESANKIKKTLMEKLSGFMHAREPAVLTGDMQITPLGSTPKELDMVESRKYLRDECLQHFQVPPEIMGIVENSNRATIDSSEYLMQKNVLSPRLAFFERVLNRQLCREYDEDLVCKHDLVINDDEELQFRIYQFGVQNGCVTREQFCEKFGINPHPTEGTYLVPLGSILTPANEEIELPDLPDEDETESDNDNGEENTPVDAENTPVDESEGVNSTNIITNTEKDALRKDTSVLGSMGRQLKNQTENQQWKNQVWRLFDSKAKSKETLFVSAVKKIAKVQLKDILELLSVDKPLENILEEYYSNDVDDAVKRTLANAWITTMQSGRDMAKQVLGKKDITTINDERIINDLFNKWVEKYGLQKSKELNQTTKKQLLEVLRKTLDESIANGDSLDVEVKKLQLACKDLFSEMSNTRAYLIARTETGSSVNMGQMTTYEVNGVEQKEWFATYDDRTRDTHLQMMNTVVNMKDNFEVPRSDGGVDMMAYPLDPNGSAENVCNCRCAIVPVIL